MRSARRMRGEDKKLRSNVRDFVSHQPSRNADRNQFLGSESLLRRLRCGNYPRFGQKENKLPSHRLPRALPIQSNL